MFVQFALSAVCLIAPVNGPVVSKYAPIGQFAGHWGIDFSAPFGSEVWAPVSGLVTFAGQVGFMKTITMEPVPGMKVSVSYLSEIAVRRGTHVTRGTTIGASGLAHRRSAVHLSVRVRGRYVDPMPLLGCRQTDISRALRLVEPPPAYPRQGESRHLRRNV